MTHRLDPDEILFMAVLAFVKQALVFNLEHEAVSKREWSSTLARPFWDSVLCDRSSGLK